MLPLSAQAHLRHPVGVPSSAAKPGHRDLSSLIMRTSTASRHWLLVLAVSWLAASCGARGTDAVEPTPPTPEAASITVLPEAVSLTALGGTLQLHARVLDANGQTLEAVRVEWTSDATAIATVDRTGLVTATGNGTATVTAATGTVSGWATVSVYDAVAAVAQDRAALTSLYQGTSGHRWRTRGNWLSDAPLSSWSGVSTDEDGRVVTLSLPENALLGSLPPELGDLTRLEALDLSRNYLESTIPLTLGRLVHLKSLRLSWNNGIGGAIPPELGLLRNLETLHLEGTTLNEVPAEIGNLTRLRSLKLGRLVAGRLPAWLGNLSDLEVLSIESRRMIGPIPAELGNLTNLRELHLHGLPLRSSIPPEIGDLASLEVLIMFETRLNGALPSEIGKLRNLTYMHLGDNELTGEIPPEIGRLRKLSELHLFKNQLSGPIPGQLGDLQGLKTLDVSGNDLLGEIPTELGDLQALETLLLLVNDRLTGPLPASMTQLSALKVLHMERTDLCIPRDSTFDSWLAGLEYVNGTRCSSRRQAQRGGPADVRVLDDRIRNHVGGAWGAGRECSTRCGRSSLSLPRDLSRSRRRRGKPGTRYWAKADFQRFSRVDDLPKGSRSHRLRSILPYSHDRRMRVASRRVRSGVAPVSAELLDSRDPRIERGHPRDTEPRHVDR